MNIQGYKMTIINRLRYVFNNPKSFYNHYIPASEINDLNRKLVYEILKYQPKDVFEFGCGNGKILKMLDLHCDTIGIDISKPAVEECIKDNLHVYRSDEGFLKHAMQRDIVFTCSVLCHIKDIDDIVSDLIGLAKKAVLIAETKDTPTKFYYSHNYESYGFKRLDNYEFPSPTISGKQRTYHIYKVEKQ